MVEFHYAKGSLADRSVYINPMSIDIVAQAYDNQLETMIFLTHEKEGIRVRESVDVVVEEINNALMYYDKRR